MDQSRQLEIGINTKGLLPLILVILTLSITLSISLSPIQENLDNHSIRPLEYSVRSKIREESGLHPKIKIYSFGDKTMSRLRRADLGLNDWASVIEAIAARKPKAIFIDKIFALPIGDDYYRPISKEEGSRFVERVRRTGIPVIVGSSFRSKSLSKRKYRTLPLYSLQAALREGTTKPSWLIENSKKTFFGPQEHIIDAFIPGSLENAGHGYAYPLTWLGGDKILPHGGILPFGEPLVGPDFIESHGTRIPVDTLGRIQPDLTNIQAFLSRTQRVISLMVRIARGQDETFVNEGDYVAILPHMYTGNTDKKESPIGIIAGGYIPVAIMNSVLSSRWIEEMPMPIIPILLVGFLSVLAGWTLKSRSFLFLSIMVILGFSSAGIASFSYFSYRLPWMESIFSFLLNGISIYSLRTLLTEQEAKKLKTALEGTFPPDRLAEILEDPSALVMRPREQELSIMFVDIVGFSVKAETMAADQIFEELKHQIKSITETIHRFGGVIDKTLGDGVMAFFGYDPTKDYEGNHARQAVLAAEAIQRHAFDFNRGVSDARNLLFLRIGINADKVYVGDVGDSRRFDFTLIGHGVNFAARLEPACTPFKIMISHSVKQLARLDDVQSLTLFKRLIQIKHSSNLHEAFEVDPFQDQAGELKSFVSRYSASRYLERELDRHRLKKGAYLKLFSDLTTAEVMDISESGFKIVCDIYLARGVELIVHLESSDEAVNQAIGEGSFVPLSCEIKWGESAANGLFYHGLRIKSLNQLQATKLIKIFEPLLGELVVKQS